MYQGSLIHWGCGPIPEYINNSIWEANEISGQCLLGGRTNYWSDLVQFWCTVYSVQLYSEQFSVYSLQCTVYSVQLVCSVQFTVYSLQCTVFIIQCTVYSVKCTSYSGQCKVYSSKCTIYM